MVALLFDLAARQGASRMRALAAAFAPFPLPSSRSTRDRTQFFKSLPALPPPLPVLPRQFVKFLLLIPALCCASAATSSAPQTRIMPGGIWPDDHGRHIQAHGGSILKEGDACFWVGEDHAADNPPNWRFVSCYSSKDLIDWEFRRQVFKSADPENLGPWSEFKDIAEFCRLAAL